MKRDMNDTFTMPPSMLPDYEWEKIDKIINQRLMTMKHIAKAWDISYPSFTTYYYKWLTQKRPLK